MLIFKFQRYKYQSYLLHKNFIQNLQLPYLKPGWDYHCKLHCACVSVCACTQTRSHECTCRYTCLDMCMSGEAMGQPRLSVLRTPSTYGPASGISPQDSIHLVLESQFFLAGNSQIQLGWLGHEPQGSASLHLPLLWVQVSATSPIFLHGC